MVQLLIEKGADVNAQSECYEYGSALQVRNSEGELDLGGDNKEEANANEDQGEDNNINDEDDKRLGVDTVGPSEFRKLISSSLAFQLFLDNISVLTLPSFHKVGKAP